MSKYDDASWHFEGDFPKDVPQENSFNHISYYLNWCIENNLISDEIEDDFGEELSKVRNEEMTAKEYLAFIDGKFTDEDLNDIGNKFTIDYYVGDSNFSNSNGEFGTDYANYIEKIESETGVTFETIYHFDFTKEHCNSISKIINERFKSWKKQQT